MALKSSKSLQSNDDNECGYKDRSRQKSDSSININRSFTAGGQSYYSPFTTITLTCLNSNIDISVYCTKRQQVVIPIYQPYIMVDRKVTSKMENQIFEIQKMLRALAEDGNLMVENQELLKMVQNNIQLIQKCEKYGIIHTTKRQFGNKEQIFHSLNLDLISHESILWCLRSLKNDEMTPSEKAIQSRIKEAFWYKVTNWLWEHIIDSIKKTTLSYSKTHTYTISNPQSSTNGSQPSSQKKSLNLHSKDEYDISELLDSPTENKASRNKQSIRTSGSEWWSNYNRKYISTRSGKKLFFQFSDIAREEIKFELEEDFTTTDSNVSNNNLTNYIIFPAGENWTGVDQLPADIEADLTCRVWNKSEVTSKKSDLEKSPNDSVQNVAKDKFISEWSHQVLWVKFVEFLKEYFTEDINKFWEKYDLDDNTNDQDQEEKIKKSKKHRNSTEVTSISPIGGFIYSPIDEGLRAIPGGRYGCAQFAKTWGPFELRQCSLGKLSQMVQKAISDDILRYQKTLLVWVESIEKDSILGFNSQEELNKK